MIENTKKYYFVYKITNVLNHKIYIGCHQTFDLDDGYMGSGKYINRAYEKYGIENFKKEILKFFDNEKEMFDFENQIVSEEFVKEDTNYNLAVGGKGGHTGNYYSVQRSEKLRQKSLNKVMVKDAHGNIMKVDIQDSRYITNELVGITKGKTTVRNANGTVLIVDSSDPRIKTGELVGVTKGLATMKDKDGKVHQVSINDPRIKNGELVGVTAGTKQSAESNKKRSDKLRGIPRSYHPRVTCRFCKKTTILLNFNRWHKNCG